MNITTISQYTDPWPCSGNIFVSRASGAIRYLLKNLYMFAKYYVLLEFSIRLLYYILLVKTNHLNLFSLNWFENKVKIFC